MCINVPGGLEFLERFRYYACITYKKKKPPIEFTEGGIELRGMGIEFIDREAY
jgi:hypothetical protein